MAEFNTAQWNGEPGTTSGGDGSTPPVIDSSTRVSDLLYAALRIAGVTQGPGRGPSAAQLSDAFVSLKRMLSLWQIQPLAIFNKREDTFTLTAGKQHYTIGKDAAAADASDFDMDRPNRIEYINLILASGSGGDGGGDGGGGGGTGPTPYTGLFDDAPGTFDEMGGTFDAPVVEGSSAPITTSGTSGAAGTPYTGTWDEAPGNFDDMGGTFDAPVIPGSGGGDGGGDGGGGTGSSLSTLRIPVEPIGTGAWAGIRSPGFSGVPERAYYETAYPIATLHLHPVPSAGGLIQLFSWHPLTRFAALTDLVVLPDGYEEAITYNLAKRVASMFRTQLSSDAIEIAADSFAWVKRQNIRTPVMLVDSGVLGRRCGTYDWRTGEYR